MHCCLPPQNLTSSSSILVGRGQVGSFIEIESSCLGWGGIEVGLEKEADRQLIDRTLQVWQKRASRVLTPEDARQIVGFA